MKPHPLADDLATLLASSEQSPGLTIPVQVAGDLFVARCQPEAKAELAALVSAATAKGLRAKWCNALGTLVAIGVPLRRAKPEPPAD